MPQDLPDLTPKVAELLRVYRANLPGLVKALTSFLSSEIEKRERQDEAALALRRCERLHPVSSNQVVCAACAQLKQMALRKEEPLDL